MSELRKLHISKQYSENYFNTFLVEGLSPEEMDEILNAPSFSEQRDIMVKIIDSHPNDSYYGQNIASGWRYGYGIYDIRHFGGHLLVKVGNSCD